MGVDEKVEARELLLFRGWLRPNAIQLVHRLGGLVFVLSLLLSGCGTEPLPEHPGLTFTGYVTSVSEAGSVTVADGSSGATALVDKTGAFSLTVNPEQGRVTLFIIWESGQSEVDLVNLPQSGEVLLTLRLSNDGSWVAEVDVVEEGEDDGSTGTVPSTPAITPAIPPSIIPTSTPTSAPASPFDPSGDTIDFGIPQGVIGNRVQGRSRWQTTCGVCHGELGRNWNFARLKRRIAEPPMNLRLSDRVLADIVAYLNR